MNTGSACCGVYTCRLCGHVSCCSTLPAGFLLLICMARWGGFWQLAPRLSGCRAQPCKNARGKEPHPYEGPITCQPSHLQSAFQKWCWSASWQQPDIRSGAAQPLNREHSFLLSKNRGVVVGGEQIWHCSQCIWLPDLCLVNIQTPTPDSAWALRKILTECCRVAIGEGTASTGKNWCPCASICAEFTLQLLKQTTDISGSQ